MIRAEPIVLLAADDYALTEGVSLAIEDLAARRLLSATGAMVTTRHWLDHAPRLRALRDRVAVGLHFNLTLGTPLGPMPRLAPQGRFPSIGALTLSALTLRLDRREIEAETTRQLDAFEAAFGAPPDYLDGHQHVHALPLVRDGVLAAIARRNWRHPPLIRNPGGSLWTMLRRGSGAKPMLLAVLSAGFRHANARAGLILNDTFGGITDFRPEAAAADIAASLVAPLRGRACRLHIAMCHPGIPDAELATIDPVTVRRQKEYDALLALGGLEQRIWHPNRPADGASIDWRKEIAGA